MQGASPTNAAGSGNLTSGANKKSFGQGAGDGTGVCMMLYVLSICIYIHAHIHTYMASSHIGVHLINSAEVDSPFQVTLQIR